MEEKNDEQNRITLSIAFIATYLTIIIGFFEKIRLPSKELSLTNDIIFGIFILFGIFISLQFFLYLVFTALKLDFSNTKEIILGQEVSREKIDKIRRIFFNSGVSSIFASFSYPIYYVANIFITKYGIVRGFLVWTFCFALVHLLFFIIFRDKK